MIERIMWRLRELKSLKSIVGALIVGVLAVLAWDLVTGMKFVTVLMTVKGDKPYSGEHSGAPELGLLCR